LGAWQKANATADNRAEIRYGVNWGEAGRPERVGRRHYVKVDGGRVVERAIL